MSTPYSEMWEKLNLDLPAHESLLAVLGRFYGDIYLSQEGRLRRKQSGLEPTKEMR